MQTHPFMIQHDEWEVYLEHSQLDHCDQTAKTGPNLGLYHFGDFRP